MAKYLDGTGLTQVWTKCKETFLSLSGGNLTGNLTFSNDYYLQVGTRSNSGSRKSYISAGAGYSPNSGRYGIKVLACDQSDCQSGMGQDLGGHSYGFSLAACHGTNITYSYIEFVDHEVNDTSYNTLGYFKWTTGGNEFYVYGSSYSTGGFKKVGSSNSDVLLGGGGTKAVSDFATSGHNHDSTYLKLSGGTMTSGAQVTFPGASTDTSYGGSIEFREVGLVTTNQSSWGYAPGVTFHWGGRTVGKLGLRSDGNLAWRDQIIIHSGNIANQSVNYATSSGTAGSTNIVTRIWQRENDCKISPTHNQTRFYMYDGNTANKPAGGAGFMMMNGWDWGEGGSILAQNFDDSDYGRLYTACKPCDGSWSDWRKVAFTSDFAGASVNYASSAGSVAWSNISGKPDSYTPASHTHNYLFSEQVYADQSNVSWAKDYSDSHSMGYVYNTHGAEFSYLFGLKSNYNYGTILKIGYTDRYLRILRKANGTWQSEDWEKIYAGYADSAGTASSVAWSNVTGKPDSYTPSTHDHSSSISGTSNGLHLYSGSRQTLDNIKGLHDGSVRYLIEGSGVRALHFSWDGGNYDTQIYIPEHVYAPTSSLKWRSNGESGTWENWITILDSSNYSTYCASASHNHSGVYSEVGHTHSYLPLSGGTLSSSDNVLNIKSSTNQSWIYFNNKDGVKASCGYYSNFAFIASEVGGYARIGINDSGVPQYWDNAAGSHKYNLYHSGNLPAYPTKASWNYDDVYIKLAGENSATGSITFANTSKIVIGTQASGSNSKTGYISAGIGYSTSSGRYGVKIVCCDQSDCQSGLGQDLAMDSSWSNAYNFSVVGGNSASDYGYISFVTHKANSTTYRWIGGFYDNAGTVKFKVPGEIIATTFTGNATSASSVPSLSNSEIDAIIV